MRIEQEQLIEEVLGRDRQEASLAVGRSSIPLWYAVPGSSERITVNDFKTRALRIVDSLILRAFEVEVRVFLGSQYPLLTRDRASGSVALYAIPNLNVTQLVELFELGRPSRNLPTYDRYQKLLVEFQAEGMMQFPMDRATYDKVILGGRRPSVRVRKALDRIHDRHSLAFTSVFPTYATLRFLKPPTTEKEAKWCANIILKVNAEAADTVKTELWRGILETSTVALWWD